MNSNTIAKLNTGKNDLPAEAAQGDHLGKESLIGP